MKCSFCPETAKTKCNCQEPFMCQFHLGVHLSWIKNHPFEHLDIELEESELNKFRSISFKLLECIEKVKNELSSITYSLINQLNSHHKQSIDKLDRISKDCIQLLQHEKFCESELQKLKELESLKVIFKTVEIDSIKREIEKIYNQEFFSCSNSSQNAEIEFLNQHTGGFSCGAFSEDGTILVTGGYDSTIRGWDLVQKSQKFVLCGHNSDVKCITLTGNSQYIISGSYDASVRVWSFHDRLQVALLKGHTCAVLAICYIEERSLIISGSFDCELIYWDLNSQTVFMRFSLSSPIYSLALIGHYNLVIVGLNSDIFFFELQTENFKGVLKGHKAPVSCLSLTSDYLKLVSGSFDSKIIVWDLAESRKIFKIKGHCDYIRSLALTWDNNFIVSGSDDETVQIWNMQNGTLVNKFEQPSSIKSILNYYHNFLILSFDSNIWELDMTYQAIDAAFSLKSFKTLSVSFKPDKNLIGYGTKDKVKFWDLKQKSIKYSFGDHMNEVMHVEISESGKFAISCSGGIENNLIYWDLVNGKKISKLEGHKNTVNCASFSKDENFAASGSEDAIVRTWNLRDLKTEGKLRGHSDGIRTIKFATYKKLVSAGEDRKVIVWNLNDNSIYATFKGHNHLISKVLVTDNEKFVISGDIYEGIRIWNLLDKTMEFQFSFQDQAAGWLISNGIRVELLKQYLKS